MGLGVVDSSSKTSNAMTPYIYAGVVYDVQIDGYDAWNNKQAGMMTRFRLNEGMRWLTNMSDNCYITLNKVLELSSSKHPCVLLDVDA